MALEFSLVTQIKPASASGAVWADYRTTKALSTKPSLWQIWSPCISDFCFLAKEKIRCLLEWPEGVELAQRIVGIGRRRSLEASRLSKVLLRYPLRRLGRRRLKQLFLTWVDLTLIRAIRLIIQVKYVSGKCGLMSLYWLIEQCISLVNIQGF